MSAGRLAADAPAKVNLALIVGPLREDGKHEVVTVFQALELADTVELRIADAIAVDGFAGDTIVRAALEALERETGRALAASIAKRIPVAAGLGGGSSDAATALRVGNELLGNPLGVDRLVEIASTLGADVPFFLGPPQAVGEGDGTRLAPLALPVGYSVLLATPRGVQKESTASVYREFDRRAGAVGFGDRRRALSAGLESVVDPSDLARLPRNDLASSALSRELERLGAFRADVTGAGPTVYGLFDDAASASAAATAIGPLAETIVTAPRRADPDGGGAARSGA